MKSIIRPLRSSEHHILREMQYHALFVPNGAAPFPYSILDEPNISKYYTEWGKTGDLALVVEVDDKMVGAAWCRLFSKTAPGYGFYNEDTPELNIALLPGNTGMGLGTQLLKAIIELLKAEGFNGLSLSVDRENRAFELYRKFGFEVVNDQGNPTMLLTF